MLYLRVLALVEDDLRPPHLGAVGVGAEQVLRRKVQRPAAEDLLARAHVALAAVEADAHPQPVRPERGVQARLGRVRVSVRVRIALRVRVRSGLG